MLCEVGLMGQIVSSGGNVVGQPDTFVANVNSDGDDIDDSNDTSHDDTSDDETHGGASDDDSNDQGIERKEDNSRDETRGGGGGASNNDRNDQRTKRKGGDNSDDCNHDSNDDTPGGGGGASDDDSNGRGTKRNDGDSDDDRNDDTPGGGASDDDSNDQGTKHKDVGTICEFKSTHNPPPPVEAGNVCAAHNESHCAAHTKQEGHAKKWSGNCHPIGQLLGCMVDNNERHGVLSSGTRTHFLKTDNMDSDKKVMMSDAFFVGEKGRLKAWLQTCKLTSGTDLDLSKLNRKMTDETTRTPAKKSSCKQPDRDVKKSNEPNENNSNKRQRTGGTMTTTTTLPLICFQKSKLWDP